MLDRYEQRTKGFMARRLDSEKLLAMGIALQKAIYNDPDLDTTGWYVEPLVTIVGKDNEWNEPMLAVICSEGVGWQLQNEYRRVQFWIDTDNYGQAIKCQIATRAFATAITEEEVDLADFVRVFGDRLETNLSIWQSEMRGVEQNFDQFLPAPVTA